MTASLPPTDDAPFTRPLLPTLGVARLFAEALFDLVLLVPRLLCAASRAGARRREITELVRTKDRHAA